MNNSNLVNLKNRTPEERKEIARKGALATAQAKRETKILKDEILKKLNKKDMDEIIGNLIERAKYSNKAFEIIRDTMDGKPTAQKVEREDEEIIINCRITEK